MNSAVKRNRIRIDKHCDRIEQPENQSIELFGKLVVHEVEAMGKVTKAQIQQIRKNCIERCEEN